MRIFGHPVMLYGPEGTGAGAGEGQQQQQQEGAAPVAPWAEAKNAPWTVGDKPWWETVPEEPVRQLMSEKQYKTPAELATAYHNLNKLVSSDDKRVIIPDEKSKPEDWDAFHKRMGRLDNAEAYKFQLPDGTEGDPAMIKFGQQIAFKYGLSQARAQELVNDWTKFEGEQRSEATNKYKTENDAAVAKLEELWKGKGVLEENRAAGERVIKALGYSTEELNVLEANMGAAPVIDLLARVGRASAEGGGFKGGEGGGNPDTANPDSLTPTQAAEQIKRLQGNEDFQKKLANGDHPEHKDALARMERLYARAGKLAPMG